MSAWTIRTQVRADDSSLSAVLPLPVRTVDAVYHQAGDAVPAHLCSDIVHRTCRLSRQDARGSDRSKHRRAEGALLLVLLVSCPMTVQRNEGANIALIAYLPFTAVEKVQPSLISISPFSVNASLI